jgi:hypothetical protein
VSEDKKYFGKNYLLVDFEINKSLVLQVNQTQIYISDKTLCIRLFVSKQLWKTSAIFSKIEELSVLNYCYNIDVTKENLEEIICTKCNNQLMKLKKERIKIITNFNFNWEENMGELMSCHPNHQEKIYDDKNFNEKLKYL